MRHVFAPIALFTILIACSTTSALRANAPATPEPVDENLWLEDIQGADALKWVADRNQESLPQLTSLPSFKKNEADIRRILLAKDRLPQVTIEGPYLYNFWQDDRHERGLWRRTTVASYAKRTTLWETVLDLDALAKKENENWVWKAAQCLPPSAERCLIVLSRGGQDASVVREFDTKVKAFVSGGFELPQAKGEAAWVDRDHLLVATDFGPGSLTKSGYPRIVKMWTRGQPLTAAKTVLEGQPDDVGVAMYTIFTPTGSKSFVSRNITYYEDDTFVLENGQKHLLDKPRDATIAAWLDDRIVIQLRSGWKGFAAGSLLELAAQPKLIFAPDDKQSISSVVQTKDALVIAYLDKIQGKIARAFVQNGVWNFQTLPFPEKGDLRMASADSLGDRIVVDFESYLVPPSILTAEVGAHNAVKPQILKTLPARFNAKPFEVEQLWATSRDGTQIPYFFVHDKNLRLDGRSPALIYGYGGFEISQTPYYLANTGKVWLEKGGSYIVANIRGGGEFGPKWHEAALKENRQKAFDDFIAVAEDAIKRGISNPSKMAIMGGSNGGLLVGATFVERPDLYRAVICQVPLLDMLRYNKLLAGASWQAEYGDPADPIIREAILKYSPYQNLKPDVKYPEVFFMTSTLDDRVHPGHARKMVARMKAQGHPYLYFENTEGGHGAAANLKQKIRMYALIYTFLQDRLMN